MHLSPFSVRRYSAAGLVIFLSAGCIAPTSFRAVREPRAGTALNRQLCLVYSQRYQIELGGLEKLHTFDINKYSRIYVHLLADGLIEPRDVFVPESIDEKDILLVHTPEYLASLRDPGALARYLEFGPLAVTPASLTDAIVLQPFRYATGGTLLAARLALRHGMAINLGGGYHHAAPDEGGGFCIYADMPIAIRHLQRSGEISRALIIDLDAHQGNGTARCFEGDSSVFTFDMHQKDIYPVPKERNDVDVPLSAGTGDAQFLETLRAQLPQIFERSRPDIVFLQAGVDGLSNDPLTDLQLTPAGIVARDELVFAEARRRDLPIVMVLGGGYGPQAWEVQYHSIRSLVEQYGLRTARRYRPPTAKERMYTK